MTFDPLAGLPAAIVERTKPSPFADTVFEIAKAHAESVRAGVEAGLEQGRRESRKRIAALEAALEEALEYFEANMDVVDGDYGVPAPDERMQLASMIQEALGRRP